MGCTRCVYVRWSYLRVLVHDSGSRCRLPSPLFVGEPCLQEGEMAARAEAKMEKSEMTEMRRAPLATVSDCEQPDKSLLEREDDPPAAKRPTMDVNLYATKKSVAQGMMDIALLTANASQLKYVLREGNENRFYTLNVTLISLSIALQVIVGILLILNGRYNINKVSHQNRAETVNNGTIIGIFLITVVNVFVSAFGTSQ